jgi:hypothetical protein
MGWQAKSELFQSQSMFLSYLKIAWIERFEILNVILVMYLVSGDDISVIRKWLPTPIHRLIKF